MQHSYPSVTDMFCGAGGSSTGALQAGAEIILALNHWKQAIDTHNTNFPKTLHDCCDVQATDPRLYPRTRVLIASPECTNHSLAKGAKRKNQRQLDLFGKNRPDPAEIRSRATMWDVCRFTEFHRYDVCVVENVVDVFWWECWAAWLHAMESLGYLWKCVCMNAQHAHPTPQSRDRIYIVFWKRGMKAPNLDFRPKAFCFNCERDIESVQSWKPDRTIGKYRRQYVFCCPTCGKQVEPYYYPAASIIDWSLPCERIGDRKNPLKPKTLERIQLGLRKFSGNFILETRRTYPVRSVEQPLSTLTAHAQQHYLVSPFLLDTCYTRFVCSYYGNGGQIHGLNEPLPTIPTVERHALVELPKAFLSKQYSGGDHSLPITSPLGTITTQDHHALIEVPKADLPAIADCGYRMLTPNEIKKGMAFPDEYRILGTKREVVKQCGNAVAPPAMRILFERILLTL